MPVIYPKDVSPQARNRIYVATIKWTNRQYSKGKRESFRQEYVIVAHSPQEAYAIAEQHIHTYLFQKKQYDAEIKVKDFGTPQHATTFYTSPIFPDTYKPVIPGKKANMPVDPSTDPEYNTEQDNEIAFLKEQLKKTKSLLEEEQQKNRAAIEEHKNQTAGLVKEIEQQNELIEKQEQELNTIDAECGRLTEEIENLKQEKEQIIRDTEDAIIYSAQFGFVYASNKGKLSPEQLNQVCKNTDIPKDYHQHVESCKKAGKDCMSVPEYIGKYVYSKFPDNSD